jgi:tRNA modification GTPase
MDAARTYVACLTPPGRAAIAVLAVLGPHAWEMTRTLFQPAPPRQARGAARAAPAPLPETPPPGRFWFGRLGDELRDEVVLAVKQAQPVPWLEVQCHGGPEVVRMLLEIYAGRGAQVCTWQELEQLGPRPAWQQQILQLLVEAPTARTAGILLDQFHGALGRKMTQLQAALEQGDAETAAAGLKQLADLVPLGLHLVQPWRVVIAGAPNVGKSSLVNALAGYTRCLVAATPGTTRDLVSTTLAIDGWPIELIDTAGQRAAAEELEEAGIARARRASAEADLRLWVLDAAAPPVLPDDAAAWQLVINKIDLPAAWNLDEAAGAWRVSARTRAGLDELCHALSRRLVTEPPPPGAAVPCTPEARRLVQEASLAP